MASKTEREPMKNVMIVISSLVLMATLSGCQTELQYVEEKAKVVKACVDNGGEWYDKGNGFGSNCYFDSRKNK
jgi:hypothetical protein